MTEAGARVVYFAPDINSITLAEDKLVLDTKSGIKNYEYTLNDNKVKCDFEYGFYFENGQFRYEKALTEKFIVVYNFKA